MTTDPISAQAAEFWAAMRAAPEQVSLPIDERRAAGEHAEDATAEPVGVTVRQWHGGLVVQPGSAPTARIVYFFGGGYMLGSPASRRKTAGHLALAANVEVYLPAYRLAPEHPFPAAFDDAVAAYGQVPDDLPKFVAGDSSGGGLAIATAVAVRAAGVVSFSPWGDLTCCSSTMTSNAMLDIECTQTSLREMASWYAGKTDLRDPRLSPVFSDPSALPPLIAFVGSDEILLDDARRLTAAAADATLVIGKGMQHVWPIWFGVFPEANDAIGQAGAWVRNQVAGNPRKGSDRSIASPVPASSNAGEPTSANQWPIPG